MRAYIKHKHTIDRVVSAFGLSNNNKWRWWMWTVAAIYRRTQAQVGWLGLRVGGHMALSLHSSNEPGELSQWPWSWGQHHKHCCWIIIVIVIIISRNIVTVWMQSICRWLMCWKDNVDVLLVAAPCDCTGFPQCYTCNSTSKRECKTNQQLVTCPNADVSF